MEPQVQEMGKSKDADLRVPGMMSLEHLSWNRPALHSDLLPRTERRSFSGQQSIVPWACEPCERIGRPTVVGGHELSESHGSTLSTDERRMKQKSGRSEGMIRRTKGGDGGDGEENEGKSCD